MAESDIISDAQQAWQRLSDRSRASWQDWLVVGHAVVIGRSEAMQAANTSRPFGITYTRAIGAWLIQNGLGGIVAQERYRLTLCIENLAAIEGWMATLAPEKRLKLNHPNTVWWRWQDSTKAATTTPKGKKIGSDRPIHWNTETIQRAADAIRATCSRDYVLMARVALKAAIRDESDLRALLP